ncbi:conserved hypothetical protein [Clostridium neonatale]|uniref:Uncharacterized protein n=1 Tax=Clostridium neonatale TaxID=137838 RepID=A0AAD2DDU7_9CLOT|nr:hypothetical protein [Clostridium neonatale]CAI3197003.1 conserved hypothetical protein [Clostridium neonatale]CAI3228551.1 conserved hypothetical protein [Clostridium neonatale]CAI3248185.1 conserved hypothetical protein [Clostridium neonatale]CAI3546565.1 conserved hypothetical protein [Clostridium neonatale]CAI3561078.1 conserved hypothetical protein [Clostridium neonatale]
MSIRQRRIEADYLKVAGKFELMNVGFDAIDEKPNAQTREKRYVGDASSTQSITSYKWQSDFSGDQIENEKVIEYIISIGKELKTGAEAETEYIKVDMDKLGKVDNTYYARKFNVAISVSEFPNNDGELGLSGSLLGLGDPVVGTVTINPDTKEITFKEGFYEKTIEFEYTATGTITEISIDEITYDTSNHKFKNIPVNTTSFTFKDNEVVKTATLSSSWSVS